MASACPGRGRSHCTGFASSGMLGALTLLLSQLEKEVVHTPQNYMVVAKIEAQGEVGEGGLQV